MILETVIPKATHEEAIRLGESRVKRVLALGADLIYNS